MNDSDKSGQGGAETLFTSDVFENISAEEFIEILLATNQVDGNAMACEKMSESLEEEISRRYFVLKKTIRHIADALGIPKSTVFDSLKRSKQTIIRALKSDLRANKKILGHMVDLIIQTDERVKMLWQMYSELGDHGNHTERSQIFTALREETKTKLMIYERFGLCGNDAINLILTGGIDVESKVKEVKEFVSKIFHIIVQEVKDEQTQSTVFNRMANEIRASQLYKKTENEPGDDDSFD